MRPLFPQGTIVRNLEAADDRSAFSCGHPDLDHYFRDYAGQHSRRGLSRVQVAVLSGEIVGYAASAPGHITSSELPGDLRRRLPHYPLPILRLARLAVAEEHQHRGIGSLLLATVLRQALELRDQHGCVGVVIDAKSEAVGYYATFGFQVVPTESGQIQGGAAPTTQMFLPIGTIETALRHDSDK